MATKINIEDLTLKQIRELAGLIPATVQPVNQAPPWKADYGYSVVVLDRGFVYVGHLVVAGDYATLTEGQNIRIWGTKKGLHQLVVEGPQPDTKLDGPATVHIPMRAIISIHPTEERKWKKS